MSNNIESLDVKIVAEKVAKRFGKSHGFNPSVVNELTKQLKSVDVSFARQDNFTTAIVQQRNGGVYVGTTKRNPKDADVPLVGQTVALVRAFNDMAYDFLVYESEG